MPVRCVSNSNDGGTSPFMVHEGDPFAFELAGREENAFRIGMERCFQAPSCVPKSLNPFSSNASAAFSFGGDHPSRGLRCTRVLPHIRDTGPRRAMVGQHLHNATKERVLGAWLIVDVYLLSLPLWVDVSCLLLTRSIDSVDARLSAQER